MAGNSRKRTPGEGTLGVERGFLRDDRTATESETTSFLAGLEVAVLSIVGGAPLIIALAGHDALNGRGDSSSCTFRPTSVIQPAYRPRARSAGALTRRCAATASPCTATTVRRSTSRLRAETTPRRCRATGMTWFSTARTGSDMRGMPERARRLPHVVALITETNRSDMKSPQIVRGSVNRLTTLISRTRTSISAADA